MASVWDAAKTLLAMAGSEDSALAGARELAAECARAGRPAEAAFWRAVADAVAFEANPQPLIAPHLGERPPAGPQHGSREHRWGRNRALDLPQHRSTVLRFRRDLRELWKRYGGDEEDVSDTPKKESD